MAGYGIPCKQGCICKKHDGGKCEKNCNCWKHSIKQKVCDEGCTCGRHGSRACKPGCTCGRHVAQKRYADEERAAAAERRREHNRERQRIWRISNPEKAKAEKDLRNQLHGRRYQLKSKYGVTLEQWEEMYERQDQCCYLCLEPLPRAQVHIDHDHGCCSGKKSCGKCVRGLAHQKCNQGVGQFGDDPARLRLIADNLEAATKQLATRS